MSDTPPRILVLGAHPDDAEFHMGGLLARYRDLEHQVKVIAVTDGRSGHHLESGRPLADRRRAELEASTSLAGATCEVWDHPDGELEASLAVRAQIIAEIRRFSPDLVITHRPNDYHPDHRAVGQLVQDASYLVTVPSIVPDVPALRRDPIVAYMTDRFTKPTALQADIILDVGEELELIVEMCHCHTSQTYEWLPWNRRIEGTVPEEETGRKAWLRAFIEDRWGWTARTHREELIATYGEQRGRAVTVAEAYEISEYAGELEGDRKRLLFPGLPSSTV
ncbi:MAG: PIG-L deacetylase family protein [Verrucomicrobiales bacterium]